jgi:hypothetical protein
MTTADVFRAKADECEKKAERAKDAAAKRILLEAAQEWRILAAHAEPRGGGVVGADLASFHIHKVTQLTREAIHRRIKMKIGRYSFIHSTALHTKAGVRALVQDRSHSPR